MSSDLARRAKQLFQESLDQPEVERSAFLVARCDGDAALRSEIESLLLAFAAAGQHFDEPADRDDDPIHGERQGDRIGPYKLLQEIGEGGFGTVWMAEQEEPVRRKVALKILKWGMDTRQVLARFEAERQALALMDHENIAKVFDGGATESGRPYFTMELVRGLPITEYCDQASLNPKERLELFSTVCHAVQHAHHKGVIHRDLKPSNVLVTLHDGVPVVKVIDFGIAKATSVELTRKTLFTEFRQMLGTPEYMAPEQAGVSGLDVDTRADVYSLGVLLYELLTGTRPFEMEELLQNGYLDMLRYIREEEPPTPSTRVSGLGERLVTVARQRRMQPKALRALMRGDLDWIVMRALEKDRKRRYPTPVAFAEDIGRYLRDEPVLASPPSAVYRVQKYVRRHKVVVLAGVVVSLSLLAGLALASWGYVEAKEQASLAKQAESKALVQKQAAIAARNAEREQRRLAEKRETEAKTQSKKAATVSELLQQMLNSSDPHEVKGRNYTVRQLLDDFDRELGEGLAAVPEVESSVRRTIGLSYLGLGILDKAQTHLEAALTIREQAFGKVNPEAVQSLLDRVDLLHQRGAYREADGIVRDALELCRSRSGEAFDVLESKWLSRWADLLRHLGQLDEAERCGRQALAMQRKLLGDEHPAVAADLHNLGLVLSAKGDYEGAECSYRQALAMKRKLLGEEHPAVAVSLSGLASQLSKEGDYAGAERLEREALAMRIKLYGEEHPAVATSLANLGSVLLQRGDYAGAERLQQKALEIRRKLLGEEHPAVATSLNNLAMVLLQKSQFTDVVRLQRKALEIQRNLLGEEHPFVATSLNNLAVALEKKGDLGDAERLHREALAMNRKLLGEEHPDVAKSLNNLAGLLEEKGDLDGAERLHREALAMNRKLLGEEHPDVAMSLNNLAVALEKRRDLDGAERLYRKALAINRKLLGAEHPLVAKSLYNLGSLLSQGGHLAGAERLQREALEMRRKLLGEEHPDVARSLNGLGSLLWNKGDYAGAERLQREALAMRRKLLGEEHPDVATSLSSLGLTLSDRGDLADAERLQREALAIMRKLPGGKHPDMAQSLNNLGVVLFIRHDFTAAERCFLEALELSRKFHGDEHADVARNLDNLGAVMRGKGDLQTAERLAREALAMRRRLLGDTHTEVAIGHLNLAATLRARGDFAGAEQSLRDALAVQRRLHGDEHPTVAAGLAYLTELFLLCDKSAAAEPLARECLAIRGKTMRESWLYANAQSLLGGSLLGQGRFADAEPLLLAGYRRMKPPAQGAHRKREALERVVRLYEEWGKPEQAATWRAELETMPATKPPPRKAKKAPARKRP